MKRPLVKICGIRRPKDAIAAVEAGADFIGMVFAAESKRRVGIPEASEIVEAVRRAGGDVQTVGVFVDEDPEAIEQICDEAGLDMVQFHGSESKETIERVSRPKIRAVSVGSALPQLDDRLEVDWILYDTLVSGMSGGTGRVFDWSLLEKRADRRFFLSGGLHSGNVLEAIDAVHPDAIDVSSGVEDEPGIKNHAKIERLIRQVKT